MRIIPALLILNVLVMIHEFGHFIMAKWTGVKVNEFAIGMGPKLIKWGKGETLYSVRAFPIGGFCAMEGEDEEAPTPSALGGNADREPEEKDPRRSFSNKKVWQRVLIVLAGPVMNLVLGFVFLLVCNGFLTAPNSIDGSEVLYPTTRIAQVKADSLPAQTGLQSGDTIVEVNGRRMVMHSDLTYEMQRDKDGVLDMVVLRRKDDTEEEVVLNDVKFETLLDKKTGMQYLKPDFIISGVPRTFWNTIGYSAKQEVSLATMVWRSLVDLVKGDYGMNDLSGPVETVDVIGDTVAGAAKEASTPAAWYPLCFLAAFISINLGIFNLLPLPALDGGRLAFLTWEGITRKRVPSKYESLVHFAGIVLLLLLMVVVTYSDIAQLFV